MGILWNAALAAVKLVAGLAGNTYALVADAVESMADVFTSLVVRQGILVASRRPDEQYPFGYGKAEPMAAAVVSIALIGAALGIAIQAVREIRTPHLTPEPWTLGVLAVVLVVKWVLSRRIEGVGREIGSAAVEADAWHHRSDALTSLAALVGIGVAVLGSRYRPGTEWASADDWAALAASALIATNGGLLLRRTTGELMDRAPDSAVVETIRSAAQSVPGVLATEKLAVRKAGLVYRVTLHVQAAAGMTLHEAHVLSGRVKGAIRAAEPRVDSVLVHMEPFEGSPS